MKWIVAAVLLLAGCESPEPMTAEQRAIWAQAVMNGGQAMQQSLVSRNFTTCYNYGYLGMVRCQ